LVDDNNDDDDKKILQLFTNKQNFIYLSFFLISLLKTLCLS